MISEKDRTLISKSNYTKISYRLDLQEQRLIYILASKINEDDAISNSYKITHAEVNIILSKHKNTFDELCQHILNLINSELVIINENFMVKTKWLSSARCSSNGSIELCFNVEVKPYLLEFKNRFSKLGLDKIVTFNSIYSCRLYDLLKQYERIGVSIFTIEALRTMFCIAPEKYKLYYDFKKKVLLQAQKEINKDSDISFSFEELKTGRKVTSIKFNVNTNKNYDIIIARGDIIWKIKHLN